MPTFLSDPPQWLYLVLGGFVVITGAITTRKQDRRAVIPFGVAALLLLVVFLIDRFFESPREEASRRVFMMSLAADAKNPDAFVEHLADKVEIQSKPATREEVRKSGFWQLLRQWEVHVAVWNFSRDDVNVIDDNTVEIGFMAKGESGSKQVPVYGRATFKKQSDGSFKLTAFKATDPMNRTNTVDIPNFP